MQATNPRLIVALDFSDKASALAFCDVLDPDMCRVKVGKELFTRTGPAIVEALVARGFDVFLDLKFHDIPHTTAQAVKAAAELGVWMVNVHASGGSRMMEAARNVLETLQSPRPLLIGVTVLTSMDESDLVEVGCIDAPEEQVVRLARLTQLSGLDGVVCSAQEAQMLRQQWPTAVLVTPGIRPVGADQTDQKRVVTPERAVELGSDYLVVGRPITSSSQPLEVIKLICNTIHQ